MTTEPKKTRQQLQEEQDEQLATAQARLDEINNQIKLLEIEKKPLMNIIKKAIGREAKKIMKSQITAKKK